MIQAFRYAAFMSILLAIVICQEQPAFSSLGQLPKRDFDRGQPRVIRRVDGADRFFFNTRYGKRSGPIDNLGYLGSSEYQSDPVGNGIFFASKYGKREGSRELAGYGGLRGSQRFFINGRYGKRSMDVKESSGPSYDESFLESDIVFNLEDVKIKCIYAGANEIYLCRRYPVHIETEKDKDE